MPHIEEGQLHAYLDGQLASPERSELEAHLSTCAECRARFEEAQRLVSASGELLERLDPGAPKALPWSEIEARSAARGRQPRRSAWLDPRFAWAASIALAFAVGWLTRGAQIPRELAQFEAGYRSVDSVAPVADERLALEVTHPLGREAETESSAGATASATAGARPAEIAKSEPATRQAEVREEEPVRRKESATAQKQPRDAAEPPAQAAARPDRGAKAVEEAPERRARAFAAPSAAPAAPAAPAAAAPEPSLEADRVPIAVEALTLTGELKDVAAAENELVGGGSFFRAKPEVAATWLGAPVRSLPGHRLEKIEVGPGAAVRGGLAGRPVVRLVYRDEAGREITLLQQRDGGAADDTTPALIVSPSGLRAYRWTDGEYVLTLAGPLSADSLRALADRVR